MAKVIKLIWDFGKPEYFFRRGWTTQITLIRLEKLDFTRKGAGRAEGHAPGSSRRLGVPLAKRDMRHDVCEGATG